MNFRVARPTAVLHAAVNPLTCLLAAAGDDVLLFMRVGRYDEFYGDKARPN
jgi:hypothetical protein